MSLGIKLFGVALMIVVAWFSYQRFHDIVEDDASGDVTSEPPVTQPAVESAPPAVADSPATEPEPPPEQTASPEEAAPEPEPTPEPAATPSPRMPKDVRCAYSPDTDRCACLDPRGFKFQADLAQCKARALGEA